MLLERFKLCGSDMELGTFEKGYFAGWRSVRGPKDLRPNVPASPMRIPAGSYMVDFSRALRDATAMDETRGLESWNAQGVVAPSGF